MLLFPKHECLTISSNVSGLVMSTPARKFRIWSRERNREELMVQNMNDVEDEVPKDSGKG